MAACHVIGCLTMVFHYSGAAATAELAAGFEGSLAQGNVVKANAAFEERRNKDSLKLNPCSSGAGG